MNYESDQERDYIESVIGSEAIPEAVIVIVQYVSPEGEHLTSVKSNTDDIPAPWAVGLVEMAKMDVMGMARIGPHDPHWQEAEDDG